MHTTLISPRQLNDELDSVVLIDCRFDLAKPDAGQIAYMTGHIPGAIYAHLDTDLSGPKSPVTGRHPLPNPETLAATFRRWGISAGGQVVAYDADSGVYAARLWWLLRWLGHQSIAVLNGGIKAWNALGFPTATGTPPAGNGNFAANVDDSAVVSATEVANLVKDATWRVIDARAPERFRGDVEPIDPVAGHIPGARNHPFAANMGSDGYLLPADELARKHSAALSGVRADRSIAMCGSGVTACHNLLALEVAGMRGAKLYAGSWSEWIRDPSRPVARGE